MTSETKSTQTERIRDLNDELRRNLSEATAVMACGVAALGPEAVARIVKTIEVYDDFYDQSRHPPRHRSVERHLRRVQRQLAVGLQRDVGRLARRIFLVLRRRRQHQVRILHRRNRRDDEDHQQHERQVQQRRDVQLRQRLMRRF